MASHAKQKRNRRIHYKTPITLEDKRTGYHYSGTLHNYSDSGLYFESAYAQRPGRKIRIKNENLPFNSHSGDYLAEVIWRKFAGQIHSTRSFGVGAKFC
jgi:hypothetical protein